MRCARQKRDGSGTGKLRYRTAADRGWESGFLDAVLEWLADVVFLKLLAPASPW